jgi:hypothetical protein
MSGLNVPNWQSLIEGSNLASLFDRQLELHHMVGLIKATA